MSIKSEVENLMLNDLRTKDCDNWLIISYLRGKGIKINLSYLQCKHLPNFEALTKERRKLQKSKEKDLQSSKKVQDKREQAKNKCTKKYGRKYESSGLMANSNLS